MQKSVVFSKTEHNRMQLLSASIKKQDARFDPATATVSVLSLGLEGASQWQPSQQPFRVSFIQRTVLLTHRSLERKGKREICCKIK